MDFLSQVRELDTAELPMYLKLLYAEIKPVLEKIDPDKISSRSRVEIIQNRKGPELVIWVEPSAEDIYGIDILGEPSRFILGYAGTEIIEDNEPGSEDFDLFGEVRTRLSDYLEGITILDSLNKKGELIKREYYFGLDTESDDSKLIGTWKNRFFSKTISTSKRTYSFVRS